MSLLKSRILLFAAIMSVSAILLVGCGKEATQKQETPKTLFAYVGANLKNPVSELASNYEKKTGIKVELTYNNSGALMNQIETMKKGDIFIPGGMPFVEKAKQKGIVDQVMGPIAYHTPVIITPKGNPGGLTGLESLAKDDVKLVIPDKDATAIGRTAYKIFKKTGKSAEIEKNIIANLESPAKVLAAITMGQGNAGIVEYSNTFKDKEKIEVIPIDPKINEVEQIPIASLTNSTNKNLALDFMRYVQENGPAVFEKYGFKTK